MPGAHWDAVSELAPTPFRPPASQASILYEYTMAGATWTTLSLQDLRGANTHFSGHTTKELPQWLGEKSCHVAAPAVQKSGEQIFAPVAAPGPKNYTQEMLAFLKVVR